MRGYDAAALKQYRKAAGLTQEEFAVRVGLARTNYVNFELGKRTPGVKLLRRLADALGIDQRDLVQLAPEKMTMLDLRQLAGVSRAEATAKLGFKSVTSYADMERGWTKPTHGQFEILADLYGVSVDELETAAATTPVPRPKDNPGKG